MKILKLLIFALLSLVLVNTASAITTYAEWENQQNSITINDGESISFDAVLFSTEPPIAYNIKLYDKKYNLIKTIDAKTSNENIVSNKYYISKEDYLDAGSFSLVIYGRDNLNDISTSTLNLIVNGKTNNAPLLNFIGYKEVNEGEVLRFDISGYDIDNDKIIFKIENMPEGATFYNNNDDTATFLWVPNNDDAGEYKVKFSISDYNLEDSEEIIIKVNDFQGNNNPKINIVKPKENEIISWLYDIKWNAYDIDQSKETLDIKLEYSYNGYDWFILEDLKDNNDGIFSWDTLILSDADDYKLKVTVKDDQGNKAYDEVNFKVDNLYAPNINFIQPQENEIISELYDIKWNSDDIDQSKETLDIKLEYRQRSNSIIKNILRLFVQKWITLENSKDNNDGIFSWDTKKVINGNYELRIIVKDNNNLMATDYLSLIKIDNKQANNNPKITSSPVTNALLNQVYYYDVDAYDQDNDVLSYELLISPEGMSINKDNGLIKWTPSYEGTYGISIKVSDDKNGYDSQYYELIVSKEILEEKISHVHKFKINNLILRNYDSRLDVYAYIRNPGTENERINLRATIMQNGMHQIKSFNLERNNNEWQTLSFGNIEKGSYIVKVEAFNTNNYEVKYSYIKI